MLSHNLELALVLLRGSFESRLSLSLCVRPSLSFLIPALVVVRAPFTVVCRFELVGFSTQPHTPSDCTVFFCSLPSFSGHPLASPQPHTRLRRGGRRRRAVACDWSGRRLVVVRDDSSTFWLARERLARCLTITWSRASLAFFRLLSHQLTSSTSTCFSSRSSLSSTFLSSSSSTSYHWNSHSHSHKG